MQQTLDCERMLVEPRTNKRIWSLESAESVYSVASICSDGAVTSAAAHTHAQTGEAVGRDTRAPIAKFVLVQRTRVSSL